MILSCQHHTQRPIFLIFRNFLLFLFLYFAPAPTTTTGPFTWLKLSTRCSLWQTLSRGQELWKSVFLTLLTTPGAPVSLRSCPKPGISECGGHTWRTHCTISQSWDQAETASSPCSYFRNAPSLHQLWLQNMIKLMPWPEAPSNGVYSHWFS